MSFITEKLYPRAQENRLPFKHPSLKATRPKLFKAAAINFVLLQSLFLALFSYLFGALFQQVPRTHGIKILWVDPDGGVIGDAVRDAYKSLAADSFPTLIERPASDYPTADALREAVCSTEYWAAIFTSDGASASLANAIAGRNDTYSPSDTLSYIWNEARYPTTVDASISANLNTLSAAARTSYYALNGSSALKTMPTDNAAALKAFTNPWILKSIDIQQTIQGTRAVYNTIVIVLILIQDFFFLGTINGLYASFKVYTRAPPKFIILVREIISGTFTMVGSLLIAAAIWAFKAGWEVSGKQFALTWLIIWLFAHANFLTLDVFTIWVPPEYVSMALITWVIMNVTSILLPFSLSSSFYRWAYALPAHAAYEALTDVWSNGCNPHLYFALPVLFVYEVSGVILTSLGVYKRCHLSMIGEEEAQKAMRMRIEAALKLEQEHDQSLSAQQRDSRLQYSRSEADASPDIDTSGTAAGRQAVRPSQEDLDAEDRRRATRTVEEVNEEIERLHSRVSRLGNFGPSFQVLGSD